MEIASPQFSFVRFGTQDNLENCTPTGLSWCLPVYLYDDIAFQFVVNTDTKAEADALCSPNLVTVGLVRNCDDIDLAVDFSTLGYGYFPDVIRAGETQVIYNWPHGFPGFDSEFAVGECFRVRVTVDADPAPVTACSNCFERISEDCYSSVLEYGSNQNIFGFNYCGSGEIEAGGGGEETETCAAPTIVSFTDALMLTIPYTPQMVADYGLVPSVEVYIWDGNKFTKQIVQQGFDTNPPTQILIDLGGQATGFVKIS